MSEFAKVLLNLIDFWETTSHYMTSLTSHLLSQAKTVINIVLSYELWGQRRDPPIRVSQNTKKELSLLKAV